MALHASLVELAELAPRCESSAAARGILAESQDLVRNALSHHANEVELAGWFSRIVTDLVRSPALSSSVRLTGAIATGDATPTSRIGWLGEDENLVEVFASMGLRAGAEVESPANRADAGLPLGAGGEEALLQEAMAQRPPSLQMVNGLPDRDIAVDIHSTLISPISAIARWAAPGPRPAPDRIAIGQARGILSESDAEALSLAWETGLALQLRNWRDHVDHMDLRLGDLPPLDRTAYGAACRMVAEVYEGLLARQQELAQRA